MEETGFRLVITDEMLGKLTKTDDMIKKLGETSENTSKRVIAAFQNMSTFGVDNLIQKLREAQAEINNLSVSNNGISQISGQSNSSAVAVNSLIQAINQLNNAQIRAGETQRQTTRERRQSRAEDRIWAAQLRTAVDEAVAREKKRQLAIKSSVEEAKRLAKAYKSMPTAITTKGAGQIVAQSMQSVTINQRLVAIKNLNNAIKDLDSTDKRYKQTVDKLNSEIARQKDELSKLGVTANRVNNAQKGLFAQMARNLAAIYSVSAIKSYISEIISVRKEFEIQQRSLQALLQDKEKADELWNKTVTLAIKSPFKIKELVTYTKQLAAYRIESDKLYDTTKMLADISAGLGVDMQRLILAYGQVKAANYLRGCLGFGTPVMLYNNDVKAVQDIVVGDEIMGDDFTPRHVTEVIKGKEQMYYVRQTSHGIDYRVNENHILTLFDTKKHTVVDIYVKDYLKAPERYLGIKSENIHSRITYPIKVVKDKIDNYYGFVIDGNKRFLLEDGTVTHNTELRQFSEAGVNILGELAAYFSEIEGKAISVGDVFEMVSKRMVKFSDVDKVLQRLTSEGGIFYRMQEIQSETLQGMISNLADSIDVMMNEIGKANDGLLKGGVSLVAKLTENWETLASILKPIIIAFAIIKVNALLANTALSQFVQRLMVTATTAPNVATAINQMKIAFSNLTTAIGKSIAKMGEFIKKNLWVLAITALIQVINNLIHWNDELNEQLDEINKKRDDQIASINKLSRAYQDLMAQEQKEGKTSEDNFKKKVEYLKQIEEAVGLTELVIPIHIKELTPENIDAVTEEITENIKQAGNIASDFLKTVAKQNTAHFQWFTSGTIGTTESELNNLEDALEGINSKMEFGLRSILTEYQSRWSELPSHARDLITEIEKGKTAEEDELEWAQRRVKVYQEINNVVKLNSKYNRESLKDAQSTLNEVTYALNKLTVAAGVTMRDYLSAIGLKDLSGLTKEQQLVIKATLDKSEVIKGLSELASNRYLKILEQGFKIPLIFDYGEDDGSNLSALQERYNKFVETLTSGSVKPIKDFNTSWEEVEKSLKENLKDANDIIKGYKVAGQQRYTEAEYLKAQADKLDLEAALRWLGISEDVKKKDDGREQRLRNQISLLKEIQQQYEKLAKTFSKNETEAKIIASYGDTLKEAFAGTGLSFDIKDFSSVKGLVGGLSKLLPMAKKIGKEAGLNLSKEISHLETEVDIKAKIKDDEVLVKQVQDLFDKYDFYLQLEKLNIPKDLAKQIFNIDAIDLESLKSKLLEFKPEFNSEDLLKEYKKFENKITEMENKAQTERLKTFTKYLIKAQNERVKIRMEELRQLAELEKTTGIEEPQKQVIRTRIKDETKTKLDKQQWDEFKDTGMYTMMFENLEVLGDRAIKNLREKLEQLKDSLSDLDASQVKDIITQIEKLKNIQFERHPFASQRELQKQIEELRSQGKTEDVLQTQFISSQQQLDDLNKELDAVQLIQAARSQGLEAQLQENALVQQYNYLLTLSNSELALRAGYLLNSIKNTEKSNKDAEQGLSVYNESNEALKKQSKRLSAIKEVGSTAFEAINDSLELMGVESDSVVGQLVDAGEAAFNLVMQIISMQIQFKAAGIAANSALGIIGWIAIALQTVVNLFAALFASHDKSLEKQIEKETELVEKLQKAYEKLEEKIDEAYSINTYESATKLAKKNLEQQIASTQRMIRLEQDKKKTDKKRIKEWEDDIADMRKQLKELEQERIEALGGFGSGTAYKDAAEDFVDAWLSAYKEAGDGLNGLNEQFDEFFLEMAKKQILMRGVENFLQPFFKQFDEMFDEFSVGGAEATKEEINKVIQLWDSTSLGLNDFISNLVDRLGISGNILGSTSNLSGLQEGIAAASEETMQAVEAYLNSIRFFVADTNMKIGELYNMLTNPDIPNPFLSELRTQTELMRSIRDSFNSVIKTGGHTQGGAYIKVAL